MEKLVNQFNLLMLGVDMGDFYVEIIFNKYIKVALSELYPEELSYGIEIRDKLVNYVGEKIKGMRTQYPEKVIF